MPYQEFEKKRNHFLALMNELSDLQDEHLRMLVQRYIEQNITIFNDIFTISIDNLKRLQKAKSADDVICIQARLTNEIHKKIASLTQRFLHASIGSMITDHDEWLKAHCDSATD